MRTDDIKGIKNDLREIKGATNIMSDNVIAMTVNLARMDERLKRNE